MSSFLWGVATAAHQTEGYNSNSDWWRWEQAGNIEGGAVSGRATNHWFLFEKDLKLAQDLGLNSYRFSIEWAKIEPVSGTWNEEALSWYDRLLDLCLSLGLKPMLTLHHFTNPAWFLDQGGFTHPNSVEHFLRFTRKVLELTRGRVELWCTFNEPMVYVSGAYLGKFMPPAVFAPKSASLAMKHMLLSHTQAYEAIHRALPNAQVGIAQNMLDFKPDRNWHPIERILVGTIRRFYNRSWLDALLGKKNRFGILGLIPEPKNLDSIWGKKTADFIGVNYYTKAYVRWRPKDLGEGTSSDFPIGISFSRRREEVSDLGWAIHPRGFRRVLTTALSYGLPVYVTENGIADREDRLRAQYLESHLQVVEELVREGSPIRGYYHWTLTDNFEWIKGFAPRFGLYSINYDTDERSLRKSAETYKKWVMKSFLALTVFLSSLSAHALPTILWQQNTIRYRLSPEWTAYAEFQPRWWDDFSRKQLIIARFAMLYDLGDGVRLGLGYGKFYQYLASKFPEDRLFQQVEFRTERFKAQDLTLSSRVRFEQRWMEGFEGPQLRTRLQGTAHWMPLGSFGGYFWNEFMFNWTKQARRTVRGFDQNRISIGPRWSEGPWTIEAGYLTQGVRSAARKTTWYHGAQLSLGASF